MTEWRKYPVNTNLLCNVSHAGEKDDLPLKARQLLSDAPPVLSVEQS